jgi:hypothetical protein
MESDKFTCNHMPLKVHKRFCFLFFLCVFRCLFGSKINSITLASRPPMENFHHVISIKMVHMAIKTINKHFMSLQPSLGLLLKNSSFFALNVVCKPKFVTVYFCYPSASTTSIGRTREWMINALRAS